MGKNSKALVRAQYLCNAGLRSEAVIPLLMEELKNVVRFGAWGFIWSDASGQLVNSLTSPMRPESMAYFAEHFDQVVRDLGFSFHDAMATFPPVSNPRRTGCINPRMDETESYRVVWGPEGIYYNLTLALRDGQDNPLGVVHMFRPKGDVDFAMPDEDAMRSVLPNLRRLLESERWRGTHVSLADDGRPGVAVFEGEQGPLFVSERAYALSTMAFNDQMSISLSGLEIADPAEGLREMYREVKAAVHDDDSSIVCTQTNEWGSFSFEWERSRTGKAESWSVVVRQRVPIQLLLMATPEARSLSQRQLEVCRRLLDGEPTPLIAQRIGVKRATLKDHTREVYRKFGVRDRDGLLRKIVGASPRAPS